MSKEIADSIRNCVLAIFWRKLDVVQFFQSVGCSKDDLKGVANYEEITRNVIVERILQQLQNRPDRGVAQVRGVIKSLTEWSTFDPYYFGPNGKLDTAKAKDAIKHLKVIQIKHDATLIEERKEQKKKLEKLQTKNSLDDLQKRFFLLYKGLDEVGKEINMQKRGYLFESLLHDLFQLEKLVVTEQFQFSTAGEQVDGSIKYDGEHYIIEAKWQEALVASDALYKFAYKIDGKMYGRGLFISINGFSPESVRALTHGKSLSTILIDGSDLAIVMQGLWTFSEMIDRKIKAAQTMGLIYIDPLTLKEKNK